MHSQSEQQINSTTLASTSYPSSSESSTIPPQCPPDNGTTSTNDTVMLQHLKQLRFASIRAHILAKFGLSDTPDNSDPSSRMVDEETMATYYQFLSASGGQGRGQEEEEEECSGIRGEQSTFYAKELRLHFPSSFHPIVPNVESFEWGEENKCVHSVCVCVCVYVSVSVCMLDVVLIK